MNYLKIIFLQNATYYIYLLIFMLQHVYSLLTAITTAAWIPVVAAVFVVVLSTFVAFVLEAWQANN